MSSYGLLGLLVLLGTILLSEEACARTDHEVYFKNTDYELNIYKISGREKGKTLMIIGGIQGDEPGGYLAADLYADMALRKGNLIVVPRANFLSIIENKRAINGDMNRRFQPINKQASYEDRVVEILKGLISQSDYLLNLHEGSGFFSERWESNLKNPMRFGQSIIADADIYYSKGLGKDLTLGDIARKIARTVNARIDNPEYHFRFNNHRTFEKDTLHPEQRRSATFYALSNHEIPAFGIETSKGITDLEEKVRLQTMVINAFMDEFGIIPENPKVALDPPRLKYLAISVNDSPDILLQNEGELKVKKGDRIRVSDVEANYKRGISVDIVGVGTANDYQKEFEILSPTKVVVRKDGFRCGEVAISFTPEGVLNAIGSPDLKYLILEVNGLRQVVSDGERLKVVKGDRIKLLDAVIEGLKGQDVMVNFLGFVGDRRRNTGEDRGYTINTATDLWTKYSKDRVGLVYPIVVSHMGKRIGEIFVELEEPRMEYLLIKHSNSVKRWYSNGETLTITPRDTIEIVDVKTNVPGNLGVKVSIKGYNNDGKNGDDRGEAIKFDKWSLKGWHPGSGEVRGTEILVTREGIIMGRAPVNVINPLTRDYP